ncbi:MAG: FIG01004574: hypothetical protein, partial [uncultured Acetobacteraceae bacterium]
AHPENRLSPVRPPFPAAARCFGRPLPRRGERRRMADGGPLQRRPPPAGGAGGGRRGADLRRADRAVARHLRGPLLDRVQARGRHGLHPLRLHRLGRADPHERLRAGRALVRAPPGSRLRRRRPGRRGPRPQDTVGDRRLCMAQPGGLQPVAGAELQHLRRRGGGRGARDPALPASHGHRQGLPLRRPVAAPHAVRHRAQADVGRLRRPDRGLGRRGGDQPPRPRGGPRCTTPRHQAARPGPPRPGGPRRAIDTASITGRAAHL